MIAHDRSSIWVGLADLLLCVLSVVIVAVAPKSPAQSCVEMKALYLLTIEWDVGIDADADIHLMPPRGKPVFYASRQVGCATLDRDNRGFLDSIVELPDGSKTKVMTNKETIAIRCIETAATISRLISPTAPTISIRPTSGFSPLKSMRRSSVSIRRSRCCPPGT